MSSFTDQKPRIATVTDVSRRWNGAPNGVHFRCYLCGHKFVVGDYWRWVACGKVGLINLLVCETCDGDDVQERWKAAHEEIEELKTGRLWWYFRHYEEAAHG